MRSRFSGLNCSLWIAASCGALAVGITSSSVKADPGNRSVPLILGVQTHFGEAAQTAGYDPALTAKAVRQLGATSFRDSVSWHHFYNMNVPQIRPLLYPLPNLASTLPAPTLLTMNGTPPTVDDGHLPASQDALDEFSSFAAQVSRAASFGPVLIELWNEWDKGGWRHDNGTAQGYVTAAKAASAGVRKGNPNARILIGSGADDKGPGPFTWTKAVIDAGGLKYGDAIAVHIYDHCNSKWASAASDEMMGRLTSLHDYAAAKAPTKSDIYVTEFGWPTSTGKCSVSPSDAAEDTAQFIFQAAARPWIRGIWYYELKDSGHDPSYVEHNFGLVTYNYKPKPSFCAYQQAAALIAGSGSSKVTHHGNVTRIDFNNKSGQFSVIWASDRSAAAKFRADTSTSVQPICGAVYSGTGSFATLTGRPLVLRRRDGSVPALDFD